MIACRREGSEECSGDGLLLCSLIEEQVGVWVLEKGAIFVSMCICECPVRGFRMDCRRTGVDVGRDEIALNIWRWTGNHIMKTPTHIHSDMSTLGEPHRTPISRTYLPSYAPKGCTHQWAPGRTSSRILALFFSAHLFANFLSRVSFSSLLLGADIHPSVSCHRQKPNTSQQIL
jgi:hypothetical protein